ncbi:hypothetical protein AB4254_20840 [Vibrio breoganii]
MTKSNNVLATAVLASLALAGCSDSDDGDSSNPSTTTASVTLVDTNTNQTSDDSFPHSVTSSGYIVTYVDNTGNEYQTTEVSLNAPIEITFEGSAMISVSHPSNIDGVQTSYVLSADELTANSETDIEVPMYNKDWQAISINCSNVNAATLGVVTQQCDQNENLNFYQRGNSHDLFVSFEEGFTPYALRDEEVIVGDHHHVTFELISAQNSQQSDDVEFQSSSAWTYIPHTLTVGDEELENLVGKNLDEVTLYDGYMEIASYATSPATNTEEPILTSAYNVITLHGLQEKPGYPLSAYKEPRVKIYNHSGTDTSFMNLYLGNARKANEDELAFVIEFDENGVIKAITSGSSETYGSWNDFIAVHGDQLVNSSFMMNDLDMSAIADCVLDFGPQSSSLEDFLKGLIDEECTRSLLTEIQQNGTDHIHVGNFFWRSNDTTNTDEVRLDVHEFEVGLIANDEVRSTVHQSNSRGFNSIEFSNNTTTVNWDSTEPKVWIKDIDEGVTLNQELITNLAVDLATNEGSYINVYLTDGASNMCVVLHSDNTFSITDETETATCTNTIESGLSFADLESKTEGYTVRTDYFDVLDKGNFFWRGKEMPSKSATFTDYTLNVQ